MHLHRELRPDLSGYEHARFEVGYVALPFQPRFEVKACRFTTGRLSHIWGNHLLAVEL
ncbi:protein of unknown function [Aminobacter niigataensis]|nr:protein of unknown function [Aminobacter niigataensis]